ncbi:hypothetical protein KSP40_PGU009420 [Platanthera guangdongensis]|uniref:Protein CYCLOPS n=1 Tax=Platanthera guangdongensis TaxID=2320717 RepID=A0ABR2MQV5_9ASPA
MEMEGRGFSDFLRSTTEEIFLTTMMENPIGATAPSMEMLGLKNITQSFRGDSEELFNNWLSNGEAMIFFFSSHFPFCFSVICRISTDLAPSPQNGQSFQKKSSEDNTSAHNLNTIDEHSIDPGGFSLRDDAEKGIQASNLYLAKAWFHSSQPMTRSRSSELRRRYAAMQNSQMATIPQAPNHTPAHAANPMQLDFTNANNFHNIQTGEMSNQTYSCIPPYNSSSSPIAASDTVSSVVSMLKGTLERKKINNIAKKEMVEGNSCGMFSSHEAVPRSLNHGQGSQNVGPQTSFHLVFSDPGKLDRVEKPLDLAMEGFQSRVNQARIRAASQEPSRSESSTGAPTLSIGFEVCDDSSAYSGHTMSNGVSSGIHLLNGSSEHKLKANDYKDRAFGNSFKDAKKKPTLARVGSISSTALEDKADPTKKRRVERYRKMAEAKEKSSTPSIPSNMQSVLKRCEILEKEVRSLKLNLSFMNRKDSEQTKQIEDLQMQKDELMNEKERLLEEIERIISDSGNM